jgi:hypothetical protein
MREGEKGAKREASVGHEQTCGRILEAVLR